ncbi:IclR family transcriptional regulator [Pseudochelatococcus sp. B33]
MCSDSSICGISRRQDSMFETDTGNRVPALEKGLDILEALAQERMGLPQKQLAERVGRSASEIFRVLLALEARGYIARDSQSGIYTLTLRLFELANIHPPTRRLVQIAIPHMENLAARVGSSCHLVTQHGDQFIVLAQAQPDSLLMGWSVKVGGVFPLSEAYASARMIVAHQRPERRHEMAEKMAGTAPGASEALIARLESIQNAGYEVSLSAIAPGVTDISAPVLNHLGSAIAALTVSRIGAVSENSLAMVTEHLRDSARTITQAIGGGLEVGDTPPTG